MFFIVRGKLPFNIEHVSVAAALMLGSLPSVVWGAVPGVFKNLVRQCLTVEVHDRPPAMELLKHPLFTQRWLLPPTSPGSSDASAAPSDRFSSVSAATLLVFECRFLWSPACGFVAVNPERAMSAQMKPLAPLSDVNSFERQRSENLDVRPRGLGVTSLLALASSGDSKLNDWKERRDVSLELQRVAESKYMRLRARSPHAVDGVTAAVDEQAKLSAGQSRRSWSKH